MTIAVLNCFVYSAHILKKTDCFLLQLKNKGSLGSLIKNTDYVRHLRLGKWKYTVYSKNLISSFVFKRK